MTTIRYGHSDEAWDGYRQFVERLVHEHGLRILLEVGGGANPTMAIEQVRARGLDYTVLDLSGEELGKAPDAYRKQQGDITDPDLPGSGQYDFVFSQMLAEHVRDGRDFHRNVHRLLRPGGVAFHFFPTLYALPFLINRLIPEKLARWIVSRLRPGRDHHQHAVFPAYYSWCRGPTRLQRRRLERLGYQILEYHGFFGHGTYYEKFSFLRRLHDAGSQWLLKHPQPALTSFAYVVLRKFD